MMKRKLMVFVMAAFSFSLALAQDQPMVEKTPGFSGGLLGAFNFSKFRFDQGDLEYKTKIGWTGGGWLNFPVGKTFSIEPQYLFSAYSYEAEVLETSIYDGTIHYISLPVSLKVHVGDILAITAGPQFDFLLGLGSEKTNRTEGDFARVSIDVGGGLELFPRDRFTLFGRYLHGLTNMNEIGGSGDDLKFYNQSIQAGVKVRLFGNEPDKDGDGIPDRKDKCPDNFGLERYEGCPIPDTDMDGIHDEMDQCLTIAGVEKYMGCPVPDTDGDNVNDEMDKCPEVAGMVKYDGCPVPDTDGDGLNDETDECPNQPGTAKYNGCPVPDSDGDGVNDEMDKCPQQRGSSMYDGCPPPDRDADGIADADDKCPDVPGVAEKAGCPKLEEFKFDAIYFATGSSSLTAAERKRLDGVLAYLNRNMDATLKLDGHADATGTEEVNKPLSLARAETVKSYLVRKGAVATRMITEGHSTTQPVGDNDTPSGRAANRRVELSVY